MAAASWVMASPRRFAAADRAARLGRLLGRRRGRLPTPAAAAVRLDPQPRRCPLPPPETFRDWWRRTRGDRDDRPRRGAGPDPVGPRPGRRACRTSRATTARAGDRSPGDARCSTC